jgi:alpha-amylase
MPAGEYCNLIDDCATSVTVGADGSAQISINDPENPVVAFCVGCGGNGVTIDPCK